MNDMHLTSNEDYAKTLGQAMSKKEPTLILRVVLVDSATNGGGSGNGTNEFVFDKAKPIGINLEAGLLTVKSLVFGGQAEKLGVKVGTSIVFVNGVVFGRSLCSRTQKVWLERDPAFHGWAVRAGTEVEARERFRLEFGPFSSRSLSPSCCCRRGGRRRRF